MCREESAVVALCLCGLTSYDLVVAFYGHRNVWSCVPSLWPYMVFYGRISSFLAVIDPNSLGLVSFNVYKN